jgi:TPR repeat protein
MNRLTLFLSILLLTLLVGNTAFSADYQKGVDAALQRDFVTALKEWKLLAERADATPQFQLGWLYGEGLGVTQDYKIAFRWYTRAAEQGYAYAQSALGRVYEKGQGVPHDNLRASMWFGLAASLWDPDARKEQGKVAKKMTPTQIASANRRARECVQKNYKGC